MSGLRKSHSKSRNSCGQCKKRHKKVRMPASDLPVRAQRGRIMENLNYHLRAFLTSHTLTYISVMETLRYVEAVASSASHAISMRGAGLLAAQRGRLLGGMLLPPSILLGKFIDTGFQEHTCTWSNIPGAAGFSKRARCTAYPVLRATNLSYSFEPAHSRSLAVTCI